MKFELTDDKKVVIVIDEDKKTKKPELVENLIATKESLQKQKANLEKRQNSEVEQLNQRIDYNSQCLEAAGIK